MATPATGAFSGTPASIIASVPPQTDAIDDEPLDSRMSETIRRCGKPSSGINGSSARFGERAVPIRGVGTAQELHFADREGGSCSGQERL